MQKKEVGIIVFSVISLVCILAGGLIWKNKRNAKIEEKPLNDLLSGDRNKLDSALKFLSASSEFRKMMNTMPSSSPKPFYIFASEVYKKCTCNINKNIPIPDKYVTMLHELQEKHKIFDEKKDFINYFLAYLLYEHPKETNYLLCHAGKKNISAADEVKNATCVIDVSGFQKSTDKASFNAKLIESAGLVKVNDDASQQDVIKADNEKLGKILVLKNTTSDVEKRIAMPEPITIVCDCDEVLEYELKSYITFEKTSEGIFDLSGEMKVEQLSEDFLTPEIKEFYENAIKEGVYFLYEINKKEEVEIQNLKN
ncbi:hypothetical protein ENBRE01_2703 [Enteropsectra breve]|nr:hypothetical protein ENBRE01_2703 [Enteropsectra breve]